MENRVAAIYFLKVKDNQKKQKQLKLLKFNETMLFLKHVVELVPIAKRMGIKTNY